MIEKKERTVNSVGFEEVGSDSGVQGQVNTGAQVILA